MGHSKFIFCSYSRPGGKLKRASRTMLIALELWWRLCQHFAGLMCAKRYKISDMRFQETEITDLKKVWAAPQAVRATSSGAHGCRRCTPPLEKPYRKIWTRVFPVWSFQLPRTKAAQFSAENMTNEALCEYEPDCYVGLRKLKIFGTNNMYTVNDAVRL